MGISMPRREPNIPDQAPQQHSTSSAMIPVPSSRYVHLISFRFSFLPVVPDLISFTSLPVKNCAPFFLAASANPIVRLIGFTCPSLVQKEAPAGVLTEMNGSISLNCLLSSQSTSIPIPANC